MDKNIVEANMRKELGKLKQKFASLISDDRLFEEGRKEEKIGKYQIRLSQTKEELDKIIAGL